ncbi:transmembrane amino acid transporter protein-domain-containing protein [Halteromyces radiatus]|uniref:transmembrane amino acid transporter protein-domain-containing protein n=1 Tax=Halteromyces radiatus TaxID=101107 RepID=UPI00221E4794|nr:transmembrane amino acid transporter protein-domain-containing protein [Halteromyces radiatus]KAI8096704.1 transmembrane amino acid transporter protein-domain-containing protein [Halteromyces radiatus]
MVISGPVCCILDVQHLFLPIRTTLYHKPNFSVNWNTIHGNWNHATRCCDDALKLSRRSTLADTCQDISDPLDDYHEKKSNILQSLFNSINIFAGVGLLTIPLGFKAIYWLDIGLGLTNYTAKMLGKCLYAYPGTYTYGDIAAEAFGKQGRIVVSAISLIDLVAFCVALVVLLIDGLISLFPSMDPLLMCMISFFILTPMSFIPIRHLSYTSLLGIISILWTLSVVVIMGSIKTTQPGSLIEAADTTWWPANWMIFPRSIGLLLDGFSSHVCLPSIYRDMKEPKHYAKVMDWTYTITACIYMTMAVAGYRMFGSNTMQEITQNLMSVPEYNTIVNQMTMWLMVLNPITKYGLNIHPVNLSWQLALVRQPSIEAWCYKHPLRSQVIMVMGKVMVSGLIVLLAHIVPRFDRIMSFMGACFSFILAGVFPILCYLKLFGSVLPLWEKCILCLLVFLCFILAIAGTLWTFI